MNTMTFLSRAATALFFGSAVWAQGEPGGEPPAGPPVGLPGVIVTEPVFDPPPSDPGVVVTPGTTDTPNGEPGSTSDFPSPPPATPDPIEDDGSGLPPGADRPGPGHNNEPKGPDGAGTPEDREPRGKGDRVTIVPSCNVDPHPNPPVPPRPPDRDRRRTRDRVVRTGPTPNTAGPIRPDAQRSSVVPGGTSAGAAAAAGAHGGGTGRKLMSAFESALTWEWWWRYNGAEFLAPGRYFGRVVATGDEIDKRLMDDEARRRTADRTRQSTLPFLRAGIVDPDQRVRAASLIALGRCGDPGSASMLINGLKDESMEVREAAAIALGLLGGAEAADALVNVALNSKHARHLVGDDHGPSRALRAHACAGLGLLGRGHDLGAIEAGALLAVASERSADSDLNIAAIYALGVARVSASVPFLLTIAKSTMPETIRASAVAAIGRIGDRVALLPILELADAKSVHVRRSAAIAMGELGSEDDLLVVSVLSRLARNSGDHAVRRYAIMSLGRISGLAAGETLIRLLDSKIEGDAAFAAVAVGIAAQKSSRIDRRLVGARVHAGLLRVKSPDAVGAWAIGCGLLGRREAAHDLETIILGDAPSNVRAECVQALGLMQYRTAIPFLARLIETDDDHYVRHAAVQSMGLLCDPEVVRLMNELMVRSGGIFAVGGATLRGMGLVRDGRMIVGLGRALRDTEGRSERMRAYAASALGTIGDRDDISPVRSLGRSQNYVSQSGIMIDLLAKTAL